MPVLSLLRLMQIRPCLSRVQVDIDSLLLQSPITLVSAYISRFSLHAPQQEAFFHLPPETFLDKKMLTYYSAGSCYQRFERQCCQPIHCRTRSYQTLGNFAHRGQEVVHLHRQHLQCRCVACTAVVERWYGKGGVRLLAWCC